VFARFCARGGRSPDRPEDRRWRHRHPHGTAPPPKVAFGGVLRLPVAGMLRGMSQADGPGDRAQELEAQVTQKARDVGAQAIARAPQLTGAVAHKAQRVVQDKPGAAVGAALAVLGLLILGRRRQRRRKKDKTQPVRGRSKTGRLRRWARALAVLGLLSRLRRRKRQEDA
jgi:MYXO-CTERM domain-containing protein